MDRDERFLRECLGQAQRQLDHYPDLEAAPEPDHRDHHLIYVQASDDPDASEILVGIPGRLIRERNRTQVIRRIVDAIREREEAGEGNG